MRNDSSGSIAGTVAADAVLLDGGNQAFWTPTNTVVPQLNADLLDGYHASDFTTPFTALLLDGSNEGGWTPTGGLVGNLNADLLDGLHAAAFVTVDGLTPLTGNWDAGAFEIRAETFESDVATGTAPFTIASTTLVTNLNADLLDGQHGAYYAVAADYIRKDGTTTTTARIPFAQGLSIPATPMYIYLGGTSTSTGGYIGVDTSGGIVFYGAGAASSFIAGGIKIQAGTFGLGPNADKGATLELSGGEGINVKAGGHVYVVGGEGPGTSIGGNVILRGGAGTGPDGMVAVTDPTAPGIPGGALGIYNFYVRGDTWIDGDIIANNLAAGGTLVKSNAVTKALEDATASVDYVVPGDLAAYIAKDGTTTTTGRIPFAQGTRHVADVRALFGDAVAIADNPNIYLNTGAGAFLIQAGAESAVWGATRTVITGSTGNIAYTGVGGEVEIGGGVGGGAAGGNVVIIGGADGLGGTGGHVYIDGGPDTGVGGNVYINTLVGSTYIGGGSGLLKATVGLVSIATPSVDYVVPGDLAAYIAKDGTTTTTGSIPFALGLTVPDSQSIYCGTGNDLRLYHDGTNSYITSATGAFNVTNSAVTSGTSAGKTLFTSNYVPTSGNPVSSANIIFTGLTDFRLLTPSVSTTQYGNKFIAAYEAFDNNTGFINTDYIGTYFSTTINGNYTAGVRFATSSLTAVRNDVVFTGNHGGFGINFFPIVDNITFSSYTTASHQIIGRNQTLTFSPSSADNTNQLWGFQSSVVMNGTGIIAGGTFAFAGNILAAGTDSIRNDAAVYKAWVSGTTAAWDTALLATKNLYMFWGQPGNGAPWSMTNQDTAVFFADIANNARNYSFLSNGASGSMASDSAVWYFGAGPKDASIGFDGNSLNIIANLITAADALEFTAGSYKFQVPANTDIVTTWSGTSNTGTLSWMEDEDAFYFADDIEVASTEYFYWGDVATDGSWRIGRSGNNLIIERRESASWVTKQTWTP